MAPHDTNTPRQVRRHIGPLIGISAVLIFVAVLFLLFIGRSTEGIEEKEGVVEERPAEATE